MTTISILTGYRFTSSQIEHIIILIPRGPEFAELHRLLLSFEPNSCFIKSTTMVLDTDFVKKKEFILKSLFVSLSLYGFSGYIGSPSSVNSIRYENGWLFCSNPPDLKLISMSLSIDSLKYESQYNFLEQEKDLKVYEAIESSANTLGIVTRCAPIAALSFSLKRGYCFIRSGSYLSGKLQIQQPKIGVYQETIGMVRQQAEFGYGHVRKLGPFGEMFIGLLTQAMKDDHNLKRVTAFAKCLLQWRPDGSFGRLANGSTGGFVKLDSICTCCNGLGQVEYIWLPYVSAYLDTINRDYCHGANFATGGSTIRNPTESIYVAGISPFSLNEFANSV
ncbi:GDSL-like Lipase/Acylhydrolase superfamily protein [Artemisia annua]|uniref:GDSL-like Lipase/Acylhydrolase superfamily protein n=1 Tax=Artemisia annua TaxID=35608 RepID=A0A2U1QEP2_ARTAN|nr:GDSL-like Lipase/Acylhydrolase superfamily protein [Artemisia annua]